MKKWISILTGLLLVQLVLAVAINLGSEDYGAFQPQEKLLVFQPEQVDGLRIEGEGQSVLLRKQDGRWVLAEQADFPADQEGVKRLMDKLADLEKGWPVATSGSAAAHFKVAKDENERHITLLGGDQTLAELYVGSSPGFRKVHVRPAGDDAVYAVAFNAWEANAKADDWIDKQILKLDEKSVQRIELPGLVLQREGDKFKVADLSDGEEANTQEIGSLLNKLTGLSVQSLLGSESKPEYKQNEPVLVIKVTLSEGDPLVYTISKPDDESYYILRRSDLKDYFKLPEYTVKPILEATRDKLVLVVEPEPSQVENNSATVNEIPESEPSIEPKESVSPVPVEKE